MAKALDTLYETIGGMETCRRISELFHDRIAGDPHLNAVFSKNIATQTDRLALFLAERLGGPKEYTARRGKTSLVCRHAHVPIGTAESEAWVRQMFAAIDEAGIAEPARSLLRGYFSETAPTLTDPFLPNYRLPLDELEAALKNDPALATACDMGRSLLSDAAGRWDLPRVTLLLDHAGDARFGPDPLYRATNGMAPKREAEGRAVVELLIRHGADVNGRRGIGSMTPLHMSARRGTAAIAEVLLDSGAEIEARDTNGETPLRRAVNCRQDSVVRLLLARGADPLTKDKKGCTPLDVARHGTIREALLEAVSR